MPASDTLVARQLDELRREHSKTLVALQQRQNDLAAASDKLVRVEQLAFNLQSEIA